MLKTAIEECPKIFGNQNIVEELRKSCEERAQISDDFLQMCVVNYAGGEMMTKIK
jgi:leucine-rich repeat-containing protein 16